MEIGAVLYPVPHEIEILVSRSFITRFLLKPIRRAFIANLGQSNTYMRRL